MHDVRAVADSIKLESVEFFHIFMCVLCCFSPVPPVGKWIIERFVGHAARFNCCRLLNRMKKQTQALVEQNGGNIFTPFAWIVWQITCACPFSYEETVRWSKVQDMWLVQSGMRRHVRWSKVHDVWLVNSAMRRQSDGAKFKMCDLSSQVWGDSQMEQSSRYVTYPFRYEETVRWSKVQDMWLVQSGMSRQSDGAEFKICGLSIQLWWDNQTEQCSRYVVCPFSYEETIRQSNVQDMH